MKIKNEKEKDMMVQNDMLNNLYDVIYNPDDRYDDAADVSNNPSVAENSVSYGKTYWMSIESDHTGKRLVIGMKPPAAFRHLWVKVREVIE